MAVGLRKRGVPPWEVSGMLGHRASGYRTTEIYAKSDPDYLGKAVVAIDDYFRELQGEAKKAPHPPGTVPFACHLRVSQRKPDFASPCFHGRREWSRTTDHYHVKVVLYH